MKNSELKYQDIWNKTLSNGETVEYEFSVGQKYVKFMLIMWLIISLPLLFAGIGFVILLFVLFYFGFYVKKANAYAFTNKRILIHKGWLSTNTISIDYSRITDVRVQENFFDKLLTHTGDIAINTAGTAMIEVVLKNIEAPYEVKKKMDALKD